MTNIRSLNFCPLAGLSYRHIQTILPSFMSVGDPPVSKSLIVHLQDGDRLSCEVSCPLDWKESEKTVVLVHGLGGCHESSYMISMARKLYESGKRAVRVNLRGSGSGKGMAKRPYNAGTSGDLLEVLQALKKEMPHSDLTVIGFSLGGNVVLKLAGELHEQAEQLVHSFIAVSPPLDLAHTVQLLEKRENYLYHRYFLKKILSQGMNWLDNRKINSLFEFDHLVTAPLWAYKSAMDYYESCSSSRFLPRIKHTTHILLAKDDPFISMQILREIDLPQHVNIWTTQYGGHMGFIGKTPKQHGSKWLDYLLLNWIDGDFVTNG
jgi:uncharacterized protein